MEINSKIEARHEALSFAVTMAQHRPEITEETVITIANLFEGYLIGDAELPELPEDVHAMVREYCNRMMDLVKREERHDLGIMGYKVDIGS